MIDKSDISLLELAFDLRLKSAKHFPIGNSLVLADMIFKIIIAHNKNHPLTIKKLFSDLPHSEMGMRYHFRHLKNRGWIQVIPSSEDKRLKYVIPTERLARQNDLFCLEVRNLIF